MRSRDLIVAEIPRLRRYARALTGGQDAADDLVQETLERALEKWRFWQRERELRPWLFSILHNLHIDAIRRDGKWVRHEDDDFLEIPQRGAQDDGLNLRDLDRALSQLPLDQREVLLLVGLEEMSYADIAQALGIPQGTVMSRLARARVRLKAILEGAPAGNVAHLKVVSR